MDDLKLEKAWAERQKRKLKARYSHNGNARLFSKEKPGEEKKNRNNPLKTSIKDRIPEETLQKLMSIQDQ